MYQFLSVFNGFICAIMITINGTLTEHYNVYTAAVIIHIVGTLFAALLCLFQKEKKPLLGHAPRWIYLGGAIGIFTTLSNNLAYGRISVTSISALGLLGQILTSLVVDHFGIFGMKKRPFQKTSLPGLLFAAVGIFLMVRQTDPTAVFGIFVALCGGISCVLSRSVNARLSEQVGALRGSLINHMVGLPCTIVVLLLTGGIQITAASTGSLLFLPMYLGGTMGVLSVLLYNVLVPNTSAFSLTILSFTGQLFAGITIDFLLGTPGDDITFWGGIIIAVGILLNMILEHRGQNRE
ncbi:MAG: DMT family transporter [Lachnospiraceae bacterium]|nr:DMT family transporter [Lachnospiraceae bacterium]